MNNPIALVAALMWSGMAVGYLVGGITPSRGASALMAVVAALALYGVAFTTRAPSAPPSQPERQCIVIDMRSKPAPARPAAPPAIDGSSL